MSTTNRKKLCNIEFLNTYLDKRANEYQSASFLKSPFAANVWLLDFGTSLPITIDFNIPMSDGLYLTETKHQSVLDLLKMWICAADTSCPIKGIRSSKCTKMGRVIITLNLIDYILLNSDYFGLCEHGLKLFTENDQKILLAKLASSSRISTGIYDWPNKLVQFLSKLVETLPITTITDTIKSFPFLDEDIELSLGVDQNGVEGLDDFPAFPINMVKEIRAALWIKGLYKPCGMSAFRYVPHVRKLTDIISPNTLWGKSHHPTPSVLYLRPIERRRIERPRAPTRGAHSTMDYRRLSDFSLVLSTINRLQAYSSLAPEIPLTQLDMNYILDNFAYGTSSRFSSVPTHCTLKSLRDAIEFYIEYGDEIVDSYLAIVAFYKNSEQTLYRTLANIDIQFLLSDRLKELGVSCWTIGSTEEKFLPGRIGKTEYFSNFRTSPGLWEIIRVLFGAIQFTIGVLQARRESELRKAHASNCLSKDSRYLTTVNRKTGALDINEQITRPIPDIASQMLQTLQRLQHGLINTGLLDAPQEIFSHPSVYGGLVKISHTSYNANTDYFCDYTQTSCDSLGRRYYFRQHQLRRFFAQIFFWNQEDDTLDVLRWVLGHTDSEMVYHYITESTPGKVLRQIKSEWGSNKLKNSASEVPDLANFLRIKYHVQDFSVIPAEALDAYIDHCQLTGELSIYPHFVHGPNGTSYKILVTISEDH